jgi:outer membrane protein TolC
MTALKYGLWFCAFLLAACEEGPPNRQLGPSNQFVHDTQAAVQSDHQLQQRLANEHAATADAPTVSPATVYSLAELIDIAQQRDPATQQAWLAARRAGQNVKVVKSALLPLVTASVIAGAQQFDTNINPASLPSNTLSTDVSGAAAVVGISWLMFDFGENLSRQQAADQLARVAEQQFNRLHLQTIFDVSSHYHSLEAGLAKASAAQSANESAMQLLSAAQKRQSAGLGNSVEVAQAEQLIAQTKVVRSQVNGQVNAARVSLAVALNVPPTTTIRIRATKGNMPSANGKTLDQYVSGAMQSHPEVLAALARVKAAQFDLDATAAAYLPKVYGGANILAGNGGLRVNGFEPGGIGASSSNGVFVGVTIPLYDGELKTARLNDASDRLLSAKLGVNLAQSVTIQEAGLAYEALRTSLAVYHAAQELVAASVKTSQAAKKAYVAGIGTLSDASVASIDEFIAREALADAQSAIYKSAAALALATGGLS